MVWPADGTCWGRINTQSSLVLWIVGFQAAGRGMNFLLRQQQMIGQTGHLLDSASGLEAGYWRSK